MLAGLIQTAVRALRPGIAAYDDFICVPNALATALTLTSGSRGKGSLVTVTGTTADLILLGLNGVTCTVPIDSYLTGGSESTFDDSQAYGVYIASRAKREGLYALEHVDIFNMLCLPGISNVVTVRSGIYADAAVYKAITPAIQGEAGGAAVVVLIGLDQAK